jgi:drug/metabolite transporter (DMT)-like permease
MQPAPAADAAERRIGYLCAVAVLFVWAGFLLTARLGTKQAFTAWDVAALRYAGSFLAVLPLLAVFGFPRLPPLRTAAVVATAAFGFPLLAYLGFSFAPVSHGAVLNPGLLPFWTALLGALFLGEGFPARRVVSLLVVAGGIVLLALDTFGEHPGAWPGDLMFMAGSFAWAVYTTLVRRWGVSAVQATLAVAFWAAPVYLPVWWFLLPSNLAAVPPGPIAFQFLYQGILAVLVAGFLFTRAVTAIGAPRTTTITALVPGMAALSAWPLLGEPLGALGLVGIALVTAGMIIGVLQPRAR